MLNKSWDVFVCHASEDKDTVARPLEELLRRGGARVWLDVHQLTLGDSLSEKIDEGLSNSHFGVVILSPSFFDKHWPRRELAGLRSREENGLKVVLPIWHNVDKEAVRKFSPTLSDAIASSTDRGLPSVAQDILRVLFSPDSPASQDQSIVRRLAELLEPNGNTKRLVEFLKTNSKLVGFPESLSFGATVWDIALGDCPFDAAVISIGHGLHARYLAFSDVLGDPYEDSPHSGPRVCSAVMNRVVQIQSALQRLERSETALLDTRRSLVNRLREEQHRLPFEERELEYYVGGYLVVSCGLFCSRRHLIDRDATHHDLWSNLRRSSASRIEHSRDLMIIEGIDVRSYDEILDHYLSFDARIRSRKQAGQ